MTQHVVRPLFERFTGTWTCTTDGCTASGDGMNVAVEANKHAIETGHTVTADSSHTVRFGDPASVRYIKKVRSHSDLDSEFKKVSKSAPVKEPKKSPRVDQDKALSVVLEVMDSEGVTAQTLESLFGCSYHQACSMRDKWINEGIFRYERVGRAITMFRLDEQ